MSAEVRTFRKLVPLLRLYPWRLPAIVVLGVLASLAEGFGISLFIPFLQSAGAGSLPGATGNWLADTLAALFSGVAPQRRIAIIAVAIFGSVLAAALLSYANSVLFTWLDAHISNRLRAAIFDQLLAIDFGAFERRSAGALLNTLSTETWRTGEALSVVVSLMITVTTLTVYLALLLLLSWKLTLLVILAMSLISLAVRAITRRAASLGREMTRADQTLATRMLEGVEAMKLIRLFDRQSYERRRFGDASGAVSQTMLRLGVLSETVTPVYQILTAGLLIVILVAAVRDPAGLATVLVFVLVLSRLQPRVQDLDHARVSLASLAAAVDEVTELLDNDNKSFEPVGGAPHTAVRDGLRFDGVTFHYDAEDPPALRKASFFLPACRTTALVGPSGAGKSTVVRLMLRLHEPGSGTVWVDDRPLASLDPGAWRRSIAVVSQDTFIFNATVQQNIAYGRLDATPEEIRAAARAANADEFIRALPRGYETQVGERGTRLSGGQQQRVALARAIIRDPGILILDEATNALDSIAEKVVEDSLSALAGDRTVVIIAHRLSTVREADRVVVLNEGRIVQEGTPRELLEHEGLFRQLCRLQALELDSGSRSPMFED